MLSLVDSSRDSLVELFCTYPGREFSVSELAEETGLSKTWVSEKIDELEREGLIEVEERRNTKISSFVSSEENKRLKQVLNLEKLRWSGVVNDIVESYSYPEAVVLFGSFASGEDDQDSDVDIAVISSEEADLEAEVMGREVSIIRFEPGSVPENMLETLANGIVLYGYLDIGGEG
jgi:DNA-binding MarR family transcriptional regulator